MAYRYDSNSSIPQEDTMKGDFDFKKEWPRIKGELSRVGQEALDLDKKGEAELVKLSEKGRLRLQSANLSLKKERLYHLIGKEYVESKYPSEQTPKLKKLIGDIEQVEAEINKLSRKI